MADPIQQVKDALIRDLNQLDYVSQNIANINTPGYRAVQPVVTPFEQLVNEPTQSRASSLSLPTMLSTSAGSLTKTDRSLDIGIQGSGFIQVRAADSIYLTRAGSLRLNKDSVLVGPGGHPVLGKNGTITLDSASVTIDSTGTIFQQGKSIDQLHIVTVAQPQYLKHAGNSLYSYAQNEFIPVEEPNIRQGHIEMSNVDSGTSMIQLIQIQRHIESTQKALQAYGQIMNAGVNELGK